MATITSQIRFQSAARINDGIVAGLEKRALAWLAAHTPKPINSDHLTALGFVSMLGAGLCYWAANRRPIALVGVVVCLALNWLGDSLDGTLARFRNQQRPRYGFYVDHMVDTFGALFLLGGIALSGYMHPAVAVALLLTLYMLMIQCYLASYTLGQFELAQFAFGPTELRIVLSLGTLYLLHKPVVQVFGAPFRLFDIAGIIGAAGMFAVCVITTARNTRRLYKEEPLS